MITAEKVYEVFGITPGPWENRVTGEFNNICNPSYSNWFIAEDIQDRNINILLASPEMLVTQINLVIGVNGLPPSTAIQGVLTDEWNQAVKAIESADSQNRKWPELLKELER